MAKNSLWLGTFIMVLIFGMVGIGCSSFGNYSNHIDTIDLSSSAPNATQLNRYGLTLSQFTDIRDAGGESNFLGWTIANTTGNNEALWMLWSDRNQDNVRTVENVLQTIPTIQFHIEYFLARETRRSMYIPEGHLTIFFRRLN